MNGAARRIAAIERTLRPFEDFGAVHIKQQGAGLNIGRQICAVDINGGGSGGEGLMVNRANAPNLEGNLAAIGHGSLKARDMLRELFRAVELRENLSVHNADGQAELLNAFL